MVGTRMKCKSGMQARDDEKTRVLSPSLSLTQAGSTRGWSGCSRDGRAEMPDACQAAVGRPCADPW